MTPFRIVGATNVLSSYVFGVERRVIEDDVTGEKFERDVVVHQGAVAIVATNTAGQVAMLRQYRSPVGGVHLEIPAGTCDVAGEDTLQTAQRELEEETGAVSSKWTKIAEFWNSPGWTNQKTVVFWAADCVVGAARPEGPEERTAELIWMDQYQVSELVDSPELLDGTATIGLAKWLRIIEA